MVAGESFMGSCGCWWECHRVPALLGANPPPTAPPDSAKLKITAPLAHGFLPGPGGAPSARLLPRFGYLLQGCFRTTWRLGAGQGDNGAAVQPNPALSSHRKMPLFLPQKAPCSLGGIATAPPMLFPAVEGAAALPVGHPMAPGPGGSMAQPTGRQRGTGRKRSDGEMRREPLRGAIGALMAAQPLLLAQRPVAAAGCLLLPSAATEPVPSGAGVKWVNSKTSLLGRRVQASEHPNQTKKTNKKTHHCSLREHRSRKVLRRALPPVPPPQGTFQPGPHFSQVPLSGCPHVTCFICSSPFAAPTAASPLADFM